MILSEEEIVLTEHAKEIILASTSPRRKEILRELCEPFAIRWSAVAPGFAEIEGGFPPHELVLRNAVGKVKSIAGKAGPGAVFVAADTVVCIEDEILSKPKDRDCARAILKRLSGRSHSFLSGVAVMSALEVFTGHEETIVTFHNVPDDAIEWYISTGEPLDKAGAYGIQGIGEIFAKRIDGCFSNVVGLPKKLTLSLLDKAGFLTLPRGIS